MPSETKRGAVRIVANYARLGTTVLLGLILVPVLIHGIGSDGYGLYALVGASVGFAQMFKDISRASMNRELGSSFHSGDPAAFRRTYAAACVVALGLATLSLLAFAALLLVVPLLEIPVGLHGAARWAITAAGATTFVTVALSPQSNMYMVTERFASYNVRQTLERVVYTGVAIVLFLVLDVGDPASPGRGLVLFSVCSNLGSTLVTLAAVASILRLEPLLRPLGLRADRESIRRVLGTSGWNALTTTAMNLHLRVDALLMNLFFALGGNASFGLAVTLTSYVRMLTVGVTDGLDAVTARVSSGADADKADRGVRLLLSHTTRLAAAIALPAGVFVFVLAGPILDVWVGHRTPQARGFVPSATPMVQALVVGMTVRAVTDNWMRVLYGAGHVARYGLQVLAGGILNPLAATGYILLVDRGASLAPALAFTGVMVGVHLLLLPRTVHRSLGMKYSEVIAPLARPSLVALAVAPIPIAAASLVSDWRLWILGSTAALYAIAYAPLGWFVVLRPEERQRLRRAILRRGGTRGGISGR